MQYKTTTHVDNNSSTGHREPGNLLDGAIEPVGTVTGSDQLLYQIEQKRRDRPCSYAIDLRQNSKLECLSITLGQLTHYLDESRIHRLKKLLQASQNRYTVGIYEDISRQITSEAVQSKPTQKKLIADRLPVSQRRRGYRLTHTVDLIPFAYEEYRHDKRLLYVCKLELYLDSGQVIEASTKNIAVGGLQITILNYHHFEIGETISICFIGFSRQFPGADCTMIRYRIMGSKTKDTKLLLRLCRHNRDDDEAFNQFISNFIERYQHRYKLNIDDALLALKARIYEQFVLLGLTHLPILITRTNQGFQLEYLLKTPFNKELCHELAGIDNQWKLNSLLSKKRIQQMHNPADPQTQLTVYTFTASFAGKQYLIAASDLDFVSDQDHTCFFDIACSESNWQVYRLNINPAIKPSKDKVIEFLNIISIEHQKYVNSLVLKIGSIQYSMAIQNITAKFPLGVAEKTSINAAARSRVIAKFVNKSIDKHSPEVIESNFTGERVEHRYLLETKVKLIYDKKEAIGHTVDVSLHGLKIKASSPIQLATGKHITVSLVDLAKNYKSKSFNNLEYELVGIHSENSLLHLKKLSDSNEAGQELIQQLLSRNGSKLSICLNDKFGQISHNLVANLFIRSLHVLPFFISRKSNNELTVQEIGITENNNPLLWFFSTGNNQYDFSALSNADILQFIANHSKALAAHSQSIFASELYIYKTKDPLTGDVKFFSELSDKFETKKEFVKFIEMAWAADDYRFVRIEVAPRVKVHVEKYAARLKFIRIHSGKSAAEFETALSRTVGIGDMIDLTDDISRRLKIQLYST